MTNNKQKIKRIENGIYACPSKLDKNKTTYKVQLYRGIDKDGKQVREIRTFPTLKEAKDYKKDFNARKTMNLLPPCRKKIKLGTYIDQYIQDSKGRKSESTIYGYGKIREHIEKSELYQLKIQEITTRHIKDYIRFLQETTEMKPQTINKQLVFLSGVFDSAWKEEIINTNVVKRVDKLKPVEFKSDTYTREQFTKIIKSLENYHNNNIKIVFHLGTLSGLRRGEMVGLKWKNVDFEQQLLHIRETKVKVGGKIITKEPKTKQSNRTIKMCQHTFELLKAIKEQQDKKFPNGCEYVMINQQGQGISPTSIQKPLNKFQKKFNLPKLRIHDLRHTFATLSKQCGNSVDDISSALGHSSINTTEKIYIHLFEKDNSKVIKSLENMLF